MTTEFLFSYGTLQLEAVQMALFGRKLSGKPDVLPGFAQMPFVIEDETTVSLSGKAQHTIARFTGRSSDAVAGTVFALTPDEIQRADSYEVAPYERLSVILQSGKRAWVYADNREVPSSQPPNNH